MSETREFYDHELGRAFPVTDEPPADHVYCSTCGDRMAWLFWRTTFDRKTGEKILIHIWGCQNTAGDSNSLHDHVSVYSSRESGDSSKKFREGR